MSGKIALIQRGSTVNTPELPAAGSLGTGLFTTKAANAAAAVKKLTEQIEFFPNLDGQLPGETA